MRWVSSLIPSLTTPLFLKVRRLYRTVFSVQELEGNATLQWFFGATLLFFLITFYQWIASPLTTTDVRAVCWPYFQDCNALHFLSYFPHGYSQTIFYIGLFSVMLLIVYCMYRKWWTLGHALLFSLLLWKSFASFVLAWGISGVYDYYHILLTATFLIVPHKEYFTKLLFVFLYFLSATIKFYPTWVLGTYFTSLELGLPLFPDALTPLITNFVIFEQVVGCWFLLSKHPTVQRFTLAYTVLFHLYGGIFVLYNYTIMSLSTLLILFGPMYRHQYPPLKKSAVAGWAMIAIALLFQAPVHFIAGDEKYTMEGYRFGMWMFDANHQCVSTFTVQYEKGAAQSPYSYTARPGSGCGSAFCTTQYTTARGSDGLWSTTIRVESPRAETRCAPYTFWQQYLFLCSQQSVSAVAFTFDHAINGGPFYRVVDEADMCHLDFKTFSHNKWIKSPPEAPATGYSVKNSYF